VRAGAQPGRNWARSCVTSQGGRIGADVGKGGNMPFDPEARDLERLVRLRGRVWISDEAIHGGR
jgi:hypothetical protein